MKKSKIKRCIVCDIVKNLQNNFRVVNAVNGYTSKTCYVCERLSDIDLSNNTQLSNGFIYLVFDSVFPEYIKIGYTTNKKNRLHGYNSARPLDTCSYVYVSILLANILKVEESILHRINTYAYSTPNRKEWFSVKYREKFIEEIKFAEDDINNHPSINE